MDLHAPAPSSTSDDGMYQLADLPETVAPAPSPAPAPTAPEVSVESAPSNGVVVEESAPSPSAKSGKKSKAKSKAKAGQGLAVLSFWKKGAKTEKAEAETATAAPAAAPATATDPAARKKRRRRRARRFNVPAWGVSLMIHVAILTVLGAATFSTEVRNRILNIDSSLVANPGGADELVKILADPSNQPREQAVGAEGAPSAGGGRSGGGGGTFGGIGTGPPSNTPAVAGGSGNINEKNGLPGVSVVANVSGIGLATLAAPSMDLGGGGMIAGDVTYGTKDIGEALDQLAREILRHLSQHKLTVVWLFDESESMKDDQKAIHQKFDRITSELKAHQDEAVKKKSALPPLTHVVVGFGSGLHYELRKPTANIDAIGQAIDRLRIDETGIENTMHAIAESINNYSNLITKERKLLIVLVTDESGDDGAYVEEVHQLAVNQKVPLYVIGRQSLFGYDRAHLQYIDPVTKDVYWPTIRRGPETADVETLQYDGLHERWDEQPSGFAPYELARLAKDTGGIYFLLPSEENMRVRQREKAYSIKDLKEYVPDYESRASYAASRNRSEFRRTLYTIIQETRPKEGDRGFALRRHFPIDPQQLFPAAVEAANEAGQRLNALLAIQKRLESLERLRDRETDKRWQADYDLMLAQVVAYQVKAFEYRALLTEMGKKPPKPSKGSTNDLIVEWVIDHSHNRIAAKEQTAKKYAEAEKLLKGVIARHPRTPWADLAQDELNRGLGAQRNEWHHNPKYDERAKLVPKY